MKILFLSHTYIGGSYVVGSHHLAEQLYKQGHEVYHVSTPLTIFHKAFSKDKLRLEIAKKYNYELNKKTGVRNLIPMGILPWKLSKYIYLFTKGRLNLTSIIINKNKIPSEYDYIFIDQPFFEGLQKKLKYTNLIYRPTDVYPLLLDDETIRILEENILDYCSSVVCTSTPVKSHIEMYNKNLKIKVIENGVDINHFISAEGMFIESKLNEFKIIYVGALDKRFDFDIITSVASKVSNFTFYLVGPFDNEVEDKLANIPNIKLLGGIEYANIPKYIKSMDVTILPMSNDKSNEGRSPMKIYEYLSCEKVVIARNTLELARRNENNVYLYKNEEEFIQLLQQVYTQKITFLKQDYKEHDWSYKAQQLLEL